MSSESTNTMSAASEKFSGLWCVGCVRTAKGALHYPMSWRDFDTDTRWTQKLLWQMGLQRGDFVHLTQSYSETGQYGPIYNALRDLGIVYANGMSTPFDAYRMEMYLRRFRLAAVFGIASATLDGLEQAGHDLERLYGGADRLIARPDAAPRLRTMGLDVSTVYMVGPILALEMTPGEGARFDNREWQVEAIDGELCVTATPQRAVDFDKLPTGLKGHVEKVKTQLGPELRIFVHD